MSYGVKSLPALYLTALSFVGFSVLAPHSAKANQVDDSQIQAQYDSALDFYSKRSFENITPIEKAISTLEHVEGKAQQKLLNYKIFILESRAYLFKGMTVSDSDDKKGLFNQGEAKGNAAQALDGSLAEGYYYAGVNLGRWCEVAGTWGSLSHKDKLLDYLNATLDSSHKTLDGTSGEVLDGYGADAVLGKMNYEFSKYYFFSSSKYRRIALDYLSRAYNGAKQYPLNGAYYAEVLSKGNDDEKAKAVQIVDELLTHDPATLVPGRVPETIADFQAVKDLKQKL